MIIKPSIITIFLFALILAQACKKDNSIKIDMEKFWNCNASQNFDSAKLAAELIGKWQLISQSSAWTGDINIDKNVLVNFTSSGSFSVTENLMVTTHGNWKLEEVDAGVFELNVDQPSEYLYGKILPCENQVLFFNSDVDGNDNLFVRSD